MTKEEALEIIDIVVTVKLLAKVELIKMHMPEGSNYHAGYMAGIDGVKQILTKELLKRGTK